MYGYVYIQIRSHVFTQETSLLPKSRVQYSHISFCNNLPCFHGSSLILLLLDECCGSVGNAGISAFMIFKSIFNDPSYMIRNVYQFSIVQRCFGILNFSSPCYIFRNTRTCILTRGYPPMIPDDLSFSILSSALDGARLVCFDGRLPETALLVAQEVTVIFMFLQYTFLLLGLSLAIF